jgi:iron complex outermembrane recepter protein
MGLSTYRAILPGGLCFLAMAGTGRAVAQADETPTAHEAVGEIVVTARRREESLQRVPDAITVLTTTDIESARITHVGDFMELVPNLTFRDGSTFSSGFIFISMRGVGNGQQGWAPVTYLVDGVPATSLDSINSGSLDDIERIEVLRGPQSALYGAGAIAGAINIVTQRPTNDLRFRSRLAYANGNDRSAALLLSGALIKDSLLYQVHLGYRDADGLFKSASNGLDLGFSEQRKVSGRLLFTPRDGVELDLRAEYIGEENGSTYQDKLASPDDLEVFDDATRPRRRLRGKERRDIYNVSLKVQARLAIADLIAITGYSNLDQNIESSICYDDPDDPIIDDPAVPGRQASCIFGPAFGSAAAPGQPVDDLFSAADDYETLTQDVRLVSASDQRVRWVVGASYLSRKALNGFDGGLLLAPDEQFLVLYPSWNQRKDKWWGTYAQVSISLADRWELTAAARYDDNRYENVTFTTRTRTAVVPVPDINGVLIDEQVEKKDALQPKLQLSYQLTPELMTYATLSRGFRAGFFNTGSFTLPEKTTNYELGLKSVSLGGRLRVNAAAFHIDYSDQQFSALLSGPPFRMAVTLPRTNIDGVEVEATLAPGAGVVLGAAVGYLDSVDVEGATSPFAPKWTSNMSINWSRPLANDWTLNARADYRYNSSMFLGRAETTHISAADYVNLHLGATLNRWRFGAFARNLFDQREPETELTAISGGYVRSSNQPRSYGVEIGYDL